MAPTAPDRRLQGHSTRQAGSERLTVILTIARLVTNNAFHLCFCFFSTISIEVLLHLPASKLAQLPKALEKCFRLCAL